MCKTLEVLKRRSTTCYNPGGGLKRAKTTTIQKILVGEAGVFSPFCSYFPDTMYMNKLYVLQFKNKDYLCSFLYIISYSKIIKCIKINFKYQIQSIFNSLKYLFTKVSVGYCCSRAGELCTSSRILRSEQIELLALDAGMIY